MAPTPSRAALETAREMFHELLGRRTSEAEWQGFFSLHPYVLSMALPLRLEPADIVPLARLGYTEPDFAFYPRLEQPVPFFGLIELKRPDSPVVSVTRSNVCILTRDAQTAVEQLRAYARNPPSIIPVATTEQFLFVGNNVHLFVIMGMASELGKKITGETKATLEEQLPRNVQVLPYDTLLRCFESRLPPKIYLLRPAAPVGDHGMLPRGLSYSLLTFGYKVDVYWSEDSSRWIEYREPSYDGYTPSGFSCEKILQLFGLRAGSIADEELREMSPQRLAEKAVRQLTHN